jgi:hypothetical protein
MPPPLSERRRIEQELTELPAQIVGYRRELALTPAEDKTRWGSGWSGRSVVPSVGWRPSRPGWPPSVPTGPRTPDGATIRIRSVEPRTPSHRAPA